MQHDFDEAVDTVIAGKERKGAVISEKEKRIIAYHEIGHALVAAVSKNSAPVHKITIIPHTASTSTSPTLNVNGLGAKGIRRRYTGYPGGVRPEMPH